MGKKISKKGWIIRAIIVLVLLALIIPGFYNGLLVRNYVVESEKITNKIRIALVTDLHSCKYGEEEAELIGAVEEQSPDLVMLAGDIFDDIVPNDNTESFIRGIADKYPCYYVTGNHECWSGVDGFDEQMEILKNFGVKRLSGEMVTVSVKGENINICGVDDYAISGVEPQSNFHSQLERVGELPKEGNYTILISHRPELFGNYYCEYDFDLVLCGHSHGGQWRIPGILNGVFAPGQGLFPKYAGGEYREENMLMIVGRGLARESTAVPRFYNRPELVIIDIQ